MLVFDKEYSTQWDKEYSYLKEHGVRYEFVKVDSRGITTWKYKKTSMLFSCLANFYKEQESYKR